MPFRFHSHARRRAVGAAFLGLLGIALFGVELAVPALALVAFVYYVHHVVAAFLGDERVSHPALALVIVINSLVVMSVQLVVAAATLGVS